MLRFLTFVLLLLSSSFAKAQLFERLFHEAEQLYVAQKYDAAYEVLNHCLELNPESGVTLYHLAIINSYMRNDSIATAQLEKAVRLYPDTYWYKDALVKMYYGKQRSDDALSTLELMARQWPDKTDITMMLMDLYASKEDYDNMLRTLEKIEIKEGKNEQISMEKFRIYVQKKDEEAAFREMRSLADEYPNDSRYKALIGDLYYNQGKKEEALRCYQDILAKDSNDVVANLSLSKYYEKEGEAELSRQQIASLLSSPQFDPDMRLQLLTGYVYEDIQTPGDSSIILDLIEKGLKVQPTDIRLLELKARYMSTREMSKEDIKPVLSKMLDIDPENNLAREQLLFFYIEENNTDQIIPLCKTAVEYNSDNPLFYLYLGVAYMQTDSASAAITALRKGLDNTIKTANNEHALNFYNLLGDAYHQIGDDERCFQAYDSCLIYKPDDAGVLNNYAYYLSLKKKNLDKAEQMSRKSNDISPDNATYLDTLAWVLFQQKRYKEAKEIMDKVVELTPPETINEDSDILQHIKKINKKAK